MSTYRSFDSILLCRTLGHAWFPIAAEKNAKHGDPMWYRCERCDTERHDDVERGSGNLYGRQYVYQDGYRNAFADRFAETPTRSDFRRMLLTEEIKRQREERKSRKAQQ